MRFGLWRVIALVGTLLFSSSTLPIQAQTVSCTGKPAWSATTTYAVGAQVTYSGSLYKALVSTTNVAPNYCPTCGWWQVVGTCGTVATCAAAPSVPSGLTSPSKTATSVNLSWAAATAGANCSVSYVVYKNGTQVATATGTSATVSGLTPATSYSFTVASTDAFGTSAKSAALSVTTSAAATCAAAPSVPTGLTATAKTTTSVSLSWAAATAGANCSVTYVVYKNGTQVLTVPTTTANVTGLTAGTAYSFTVASTDAFGTSAKSAALSVTTQSSGSSPVKVEAESYSVMSGVITEACSDTGGGQSVGSIDVGDWMVYPITIPTSGSYTIQYRVASIYSGKTLSADLSAGAVQLGTVAIPNTGGWQAWQTVSQTVNLNAGTWNFGLNGSTGGWNLNYFTITYNGGGNGGTGNLIALNAGAQMTFQFVNNTAGKYANNQIYVLMIARNAAGKFCYLDKNGAMNLCVSGQNASSYSIKMSDFAGFQFPTFLDSGRLYISLGTPLSIPINSDINGNVGIAFPNIENPADANINTYFEWVEFAVINNAIWCNTTQVDQFGFPMVMELFTGSGSSYTSFGKVGMTETRAAIMSAYAASVPAAFQGLASTYRILAPIHGSFGAAGSNSTYFDSYINSIWTKYKSSPLVITIPQGTFTGYVQSDNRLRFTRPSDGLSYYVAKPNSQAVWGGLGALASPSPETAGNGPAISIELALEAQICAAFHRHVMDNASDWNTPSKYYLAGPADYFSKFFHDHSINARAYGYCYDDVNDQSSTMTCGSPRGIILSIGF